MLFSNALFTSLLHLNLIKNSSNIKNRLKIELLNLIIYIAKYLLQLMQLISLINNLSKFKIRAIPIFR